MNRIEVKVCVCSECIMNGAMDIVESVESLQSLKAQLRLKSKILVSANEVLCPKGDKECSPKVIINGEVFDHTNSETVAEKIVSMIARGNE